MNMSTALRSGLLFALFGIFGVGCASTRHAAIAPQPRMPREELARYYDYPREPIRATVRNAREGRRWTRQVVEFDLQLPPDLKAKATERVPSAKSRSKRDHDLEHKVRFDYFRPNSDGPHPLVLVSTVLGSHNFAVEPFARYLAAHGMCAAVVHRTSDFPSAEEGVEGAEDHFRKSVLRLRQTIDWAAMQPEIDSTKVASYGVSFGAIVNSTAAGAEPRIGSHVFALGGANLPDLILTTLEPRVRYHVFRIARRHGWDSAQLREELHAALKSDPLNSAPHLQPENVLMIVAELDFIVGARHSSLLWERLGEPRKIVVTMDHASAALSMPLLQEHVLRFLQEKFGMPVKEPYTPASFEACSSKQF